MKYLPNFSYNSWKVGKFKPTVLTWKLTLYLIFPMMNGLGKYIVFAQLSIITLTLLVGIKR